MESAEDLEYVKRWFDNYLDKGGIESIVAYLSEFLEQTQSEESNL